MYCSLSSPCHKFKHCSEEVTDLTTEASRSNVVVLPPISQQRSLRSASNSVSTSHPPGDLEELVENKIPQSDHDRAPYQNGHYWIITNCDEPEYFDKRHFHSHFDSSKEQGFDAIMSEQRTPLSDKRTGELSLGLPWKIGTTWATLRDDYKSHFKS